MELSLSPRGDTPNEQRGDTLETEATKRESERGAFGATEQADFHANVDTLDNNPDAEKNCEPVSSRNEDYLTLDDVDNNDEINAPVGEPDLDIERPGSHNSQQENVFGPPLENPTQSPDILSNYQGDAETQREADTEGEESLNVPNSGPSRSSRARSSNSRNSLRANSRLEDGDGIQSPDPVQTGTESPVRDETDFDDNVVRENEHLDGGTDEDLRSNSQTFREKEQEEEEKEEAKEDKEEEEEEEEEERPAEEKEEEDVDERKGTMDEDNPGTFTLDQSYPDKIENEDSNENDAEKGSIEQETEQEKNSGYIASREATVDVNVEKNGPNSQSDRSREATQESSKPPVKKGAKKDNLRRKPSNKQFKRTAAPKEPLQETKAEEPPEPPAMDSDTEAELTFHGAARPRRRDQNNSHKSKEVRERYDLYTNGTNLPPANSDDELNSSESDVMGTVRDEERYEESKLRDLSNNNRNDELLDDPADPSSLKKGRRVFFFRNGDIHLKPKQVLISNRTYQNFEKLLIDLSTIVETSTGVKYIFSWPDGREVKSITQFQNGKYYVCSSTSRLQRVDYGNSKENPWKGGKLDRKENFLFQKDGKVQSPLRKPRVLTIISNMYRDSREKLILNTNSSMNFEEILHDICNMVNIPNPPVRALFTERKPHTQVFSYSQLIRDFADHDNFLACGEEMVPLELSSKRPLQNGYSMSSDGSKKGSKRTPRYVPPLEDGYGSPTRSSVVTAYQSHPNGVARQPKADIKIRRRKTDSVRVDINGKTREFFPPTLMEESEDGAKPDKKLRLEWVYGFRGRDVKQNLAVLPSSGELVYFVAAVVVLYDKRFSTQKHYLGHSEEITCLTVHPNGRFIATGQTAGKTPESGAHIRIWDGMSLSTYAVIGLGVFHQGIACLNFSEKESQMLNGLESISGDLLMAIDDSDRHVMSVWEWQTEKMVAKTTTTADPVVSGCFYPFDDTLLITYGKEHIHFWRMFWEKGRKVMRDKLSGNFEEDVPKYVTSVCFSPTGDVITGDSNGTVLIWTRDNNCVFSVNENTSIQTKRAHRKSVAALCMLGDGTLFSGGGNEIKAWDSINNYSLVKERLLPDSAGNVRSLVPVNTGGLDGSIYVTTTRNKVLEGSLQLKFKFVIQSHVEELWALESHPLEQTFVSAGHDQTVIKWSAVSHAPVWKVDVEKPCTSISIDPKGRLIALGTTGGKVIVLNSYNGIQLMSLLTGQAQINALSFSPDGKRLAVGTFDGSILIFFVQEEGHSFFKAQTASLKHNNMFIMHLDWSMDSKYLQAVLGDYDIIYWDVTNMQRIKAARSLRDVNWATLNCPIGHSVIGPWQNLDRGEVINVVNRSQYRDFMVVGDSKGRIRLYKWPCSLPKAGCRNTKVYSSNVTCLTFSCDDGYVISSGGTDAALMQFAVLDPNNLR